MCLERRLVVIPFVGTRPLTLEPFPTLSDMEPEPKAFGYGARSANEVRLDRRTKVDTRERPSDEGDNATCECLLAAAVVSCEGHKRDRSQGRRFTQARQDLHAVFCAEVEVQEHQADVVFLGSIQGALETAC
jgi:hypothetical protein